MKIEIQKAKPEDTEGIKKVEESCDLEPWNKDAYETAIRNSLYEIIVAVHGENVAGFIQMRLITNGNPIACSHTTSLLEVELLNLGVLPEFRREGLASRLFVSAINSLPEADRIMISLEVRVSNSIANRFYRKMGFRDAGTRPNFYTRPTEDALVMTWEKDKVLAVNSDSALLSKA